MSDEQLQALISKVRVESNLQQKLNAAANIDTVIEIAYEAGFSLSADKLMKPQ